MLKTLRTNTKWIMIIVAVCFVGMIVFAWGMDITGRRSGVSAGIIGKINGEKIPYNLYDSVVKQQRQLYSGNTRTTLDQDRRLHSEVWNSIVTQKLIEQDIEKRNITYTDRELVSFMMNNPIQIAYQIPLFQENEAFSLKKYQAFLSNPDNLNNPQTAELLRYIETEASSRLPAIKFQQHLYDTINVTDSQVRERWLRDNENRKAEWVFLSASSLYQVAAQVAPEEVLTYFGEHKDDYKRDERRTLDAVFFRLAPTAEDSSDVLERAGMLVERARRGENFAELANEYSEDPGNINSSGERQGGDLGFFGRGRMVPDFEKAAFSLKPGEVSEPVLSQFGYHVIKVDSVKYKDDKSDEVDQVKARHILLNIEPSGETRDAVETSVRSFYESVNGGMDFSIQAQLDSLNVARTRPFQKDATFIPGIMGSSELLVHRAFRAKAGDVMNIYVTDTGYYVMRVADVLEPGVPPIDEVKSEVENALRMEIRSRYAGDFINSVYARFKEGMSLEEAVEADSVKVATVRTEVVTRNHFISGLGTLNPFIAKIFELENPGDTTGPAIFEKGSGIAVLREILPVDEEKFKKDRDQLRQTMENELRNEVITRYLEGLKEKAKIIDNRDMFVGL